MRTKLLTIFLAPMLLFSFTTVFGQSLNNTIDMNAPFTVNTEVHSVQNTLDGGPITEVFGLNENMFGPSGLRGRGNIFLCTTPRKLIEHLFYLNPTAAANMWFVVYEGATQQGIYNLVNSINVPNQGPGEGWYSSGAIDFDFQAGMYYAIYTQWDVTANYWNENPVAPPYPIPASFGELQSGYGWNDVPTYGEPPPATQNVQEGFIEPVAYYQTIVTEDIGGGTVTIAYAIEDLDGDFIPDHLGETVTVEGVVFSPNFQTTNNSFYIWDEVTTSSSGASRGTDIFMFGPPVFDWQPGDLLQITGEVDQFNGMTEIIPADSSGWVLVSSGNPTPDLIELTLAQYKANPEAYEGSLVGFISLTLVGGTWPTSGSTNLQFSDGIDTVTFRIDSDTDIPGQPEPVWPRDILGVGSQFDNSPPFDGGYQIFPRYYATDFLPAGTIPVELTSFTAQVSNRVVTLNWTTATELNNQMFEIERRSEDGKYIIIGYVNGHGTTTEPQEYSYIDNTVEIGTFFYRLKQIDFGGRYAYSDVVQVDVVAPANFTLEQNYPNPFNPSTKITFNLAVDSKVSLKVFDVLGQEVTKLITTNMTAGVHEVIFNASSLNSGVYFYQLEATASDGTNFTSVKKMILTK